MALWATSCEHPFQSRERIQVDSVQLDPLSNGQATGAEATLRSTNAMLRALIQASPLAIYAMDRGGNIQSWNGAAERMFGWNEAEALGRPVPFVTPDKAEEARQLRERVLQGETFTGI